MSDSRSRARETVSGLIHLERFSLERGVQISLVGFFAGVG